MQTSKVSTTEYGVLKSDPPWVEGGGGLDIMRKAPRNPLKYITSKPFTLFLNRVRTKFSVVDDDNDMQVVRSRTRPRKYGQNPRKMEATKDLKASKNASLKQNIDASSINNASYQTENAGYITPLPPPLVSTCRCLNSIKK